MTRSFNPGPSSIVTSRNYALTQAEKESEVATRHHLRGMEQAHLKGRVSQYVAAELSAGRYDTQVKTEERMWEIKEATQRPAKLQARLEHVYDKCADRLDTYLEFLTDSALDEVVALNRRHTIRDIEYQRDLFGRIKDE
jgi:hypothetical protein